MSFAAPALDGAPAAAGRTPGPRLGGDVAWTVLVSVISFFALLPILALVVISLTPAGEVWAHLISTVLPRAISTTALLMLGVAGVVTAVGVTTAWLVTMCRFPGRRLFDWALLLPLAVPTYIVAYTYVEAMDVTGPIQTTIRAVFGFTSARDYWFPEIRSLPGAVFVMGMVLYPYVYLTTRAMFLMQSACALDVARTLGANPLRLFSSVALPLARPAIAVGVTLAMMECLNDIGAVEHLGVKTLTFSIYDTWLNRGSLAGAAQMATAMLVIVFLLIWLERFARRHQRYHQTSSRYRMLPNYRLTGWKAALAILACSAPIVLGFLVPASVLADVASRRLEQLSAPGFLSAVVNSIGLSLAAVVLTVLTGLLVAYTLRLRRNRLIHTIARFSTIGYAVPGTVLAVGILIPSAAFDNFLDGTMRATFGISTGLLLTGSGAVIVYGYATRFLAVAFGTLESGLQKVSPNLDMASRALGRTAARSLVEIHMPMIKPALATASMLVFVECMKELPATILLRPFNFETLSTTVYAAASQEAFERGAVAALAIVAVGLLPVIFLARTSSSTFRDRKAARRERAGA
ncbi:iron(III) transport system permease protein [Rhodobium orientis]|uniref:Iron ABC transporter permease n=1 Tax=Rhodobium orientis TaxID=34017 RepID=A0A327JGR7_9HYPH|nr:iron ABC transporter permease [Rhodobium orientis]MBB4304106.1 iron(III) transport system permease protein [Rhodobium orientis]MBK5948615.1 iron ABC transporter permease [Rhodobium orientis]RAI24287.1 iron ABC transporter permease [Rhodobium orientis]